MPTNHERMSDISRASSEIVFMLSHSEVIFFQSRYYGWFTESISKRRKPNWEVSCFLVGRIQMLQAGSPSTDRKVFIFEKKKKTPAIFFILPIWFSTPELDVK